MKTRTIASTVLSLLLLLTNLVVMSEPSSAQQQLPDLVVLGAWQSGNQICYRIQNIGSASIGGVVGAPTNFYNALFIDGQPVAEDSVTTPLAPGQQLDRCFNYQFQMTSPQHTIMVCADWKQNVAESNEGNNCWQEVWVMQEKLPDLVVTKIWQEGNTIRYRVENIGQGSVINPLGGTIPLCNALFIDGEPVAIDWVNIQEMMPGQFIDELFDYYWEMTPPKHTIMVCTDYEQNIKEANEQNNCKQETWYLEEKLPDLVITEIRCDQENSRIGYVIKNVGKEIAKGAHATTLSVDGKEVAHDLVSIDLKPGATYESWFKEYRWRCQTVRVKVCADNYGEVRESDEQNNCLEMVCECLADVRPPRIISGPTVSELTQTLAIICWETDEESDSRLKYDSHSGKFESVVEDKGLVKQHCLKLANLQPGTTYHFMVESTDSAGNRATSRRLSFQTLPPPDEKKPSLSLRLPRQLSGRVLISAEAKDNTGVDLVVFSLDGKPMHTDFSPPFEWWCDTRFLPEGEHNFGAQAFDPAGNVREESRLAAVRNRFSVDLSPVKVRILSPASRSEVYERVVIMAEISHDYDLRISHIEFKIDEDIIKQEDFDPPISLVPILTPTYIVTCPWDTRDVELGEHIVSVRVRDEAENWGEAAIRVEVIEPPVPLITVTEDVQRVNNYFEVTLTLQNNSDTDVTNLTVSHSSVRFQFSGDALLRSVDWADFGSIRCTVTNDRGQYWRSTLQASLGMLQQHRTKVLKYYAVPMLVYPGIPDLPSPSLTAELTISFQAHGREYSLHPSPLTEPSLTEWYLALRAADYLIVTRPSALFPLYPEAEVNELLSTMAELAKEKLGVLGYLRSGTTAGAFKYLIDRDGAWSIQLCPGWAEGNGYLLIVGEAPDIVPAFQEPCHVHFTGRGTCPICGQTNVDAVTTIRITDFSYADTCGTDEMPDIRVGRIIGQTAEELMLPIRASLDVYNDRAFYDCSDAYLISGWEGTWEMFIRNLDEGTRAALIAEGIRRDHISTNYTAEFYTTKRNLLQDALGIRGRKPEEMKGEGATWDSYSDNELVCWLLLIEDPDVINSQIAGGRPDWITDEMILANADRFVSTDVLNHAVEIAEEIEHDRRGGIYGEYTYDNWTGEDVLRNHAASVKSSMPEKDIIIFSGHGGPGSWACVLDDWTTSNCPIEPISFGSHRPMVIAFSCLTGNYGGSQSIARAFLRNGAAVYIGATEVAPSCKNEVMATGKFWEYWSTTSRIGDALLELKRWMIAQHDEWWRYVAYEYNLYGDPKFGGD